MPASRSPSGVPNRGARYFAAGALFLLGMLFGGPHGSPAPLAYRGAIEPADSGDGDDGDQFGFYLDFGGPTLAASAVGDVDGLLGTRTTTLYRRSGSVFVLDGKVRGLAYGQAVAPDGESVATAISVNGNGTPPFMVMLYRRRADGLGWAAAQNFLSPSASTSDGFGNSFAWDGSVLVVGAQSHSLPNTSGQQGRVYVYSDDGTGNLVPRGGLQAGTSMAGAFFGNAIAILGDTIAVSAPYETTATAQGAVYVFTRHPTLISWSQTAKILPPQAGTTQAFGLYGMAMATLPPLNGNPATPTLYVAAVHQAGSAGRVYRFQPGTPSNWSWVDTFAPPPSLTGAVRYGLWLDALGDHVAIGSTDPVNVRPRSTTVLERQSNGGFSLARTYDDATEGNGLGVVTLGGSDAAPLLAVGSPYRDPYSRTDQGAVFTAARGAGGWPATLTERIDTGESAADSDYGAALSIAGDAAAVGAPRHHVGSRRDQGMVYLLARDAGGQWTPGARIVAPDGSAGDGFGSRVALDGDTLAVAAPGDDVGGNSNLGSVYVFVRNAGTWSLQQKLGTCFGVTNDVLLADRGLSLHGDRLLFASGPPQGACLYRRSGTQWTLEQQFPGNDNSALAVLAPDGQRLVLGQSAGFALQVWRHDAGAWAFEDEIVLDGPSYVCCDNVAFDGNRLAVNATQATPTFAAALRTFVRNGNSWLPEATLAPAQLVGGAQADFGRVVALHGDTILSSAPGGAAPAIHRFMRGPGGWAEEGRYPLPEAVAANGFGHALALDARSVLVGAFLRNGTTLFSNPREGGVYAWALPGDAVFAHGFEP